MKSKQVSSKNPPRLLFAMFGVLFLMVSITILSSGTGLNAIQAVGSLGETIAQILRPGPNTGKIARNLSGDTLIEESYDRCLVIDPNLNKVKTAGELISSNSLPILGDNIGGANMTLTLGRDFSRGTNNVIMEYAASLGMSYNLAMAIDDDPKTLSDAKTFVQDSYESGFIPIIRLCYIGACEFTNPGKVANFYRNITEINIPFIAMVGPNEPGTGSPLEMDKFGATGSMQSKYAYIANFVNLAARQLQDLRQGGRIYLSPGAFNLSNNSMEGGSHNDVANLLYAPGTSIDPTLFDYLMGNTYAQGFPKELNGGEMTKAYEYYKEGSDGEHSLYDKAAEFSIPVILTEFGTMRDGKTSPTIIEKEAEQAFVEFCQDDFIEGVLFFRNFLDDAGNKINPLVEDNLSITKSKIAKIIGNCQKASPYRDWSWASCNFDSCVYQNFTYDDKSFAAACGSKDQASNQSKFNGAGLKVECNGNVCTTQSIGTVEVSMPIKQFGSNSSAGTPTHPFTPICADLARLVGGSDFDALNQFAGILTSGGQGTTTVPIDPTTINYNDGRAKAPSVTIVGDSQVAPGGDRGIFLPDQWFNSVDRSGAQPGSGADGFLGGFADKLNAAKNSNAEWAVVMMGTNDCPAYDAATFGGNYSQIVTQLTQSGKNVLLLSIPYRTDSLSSSCNDSKVDSYNSTISGIAGNLNGNNGKQVKYLDLQFPKDLKSTYLHSDGIHVINYQYINQAIYSSLMNQSTPSFTSGTQTQSEFAYAMPWLGSAINCASEIIKYTDELGVIGNSSSSLDDVNVHPGSNIEELLKEMTSGDINGQDWEKVFGLGGTLVVGQSESEFALDERTSCLSIFGQRFCYEKSTSSEDIKQNRPYQPYAPLIDYEPTSCSTGSIYLKDEKNYIIGPEIVTQSQKTEWQGTASQVCYKYATRKTISASDTIAGVDFPQYFTDDSQGDGINQDLEAAKLDCQFNPQGNLLMEGDLSFCPSFGCTSEQIADGTCNLPPSYSTCFQYAQDPADEIYITTTNYPSIPNYEIPGAYDALYYMYLRLQNALSQQDKKIIFGENIAWEMRVSAKVRDANRGLNEAVNDGFPSDQVGVYRYGQDLDSCQIPTNLFNNNSLLAKNNPIKTKSYYYDWLGYLDIMQEMYTTYASDTTFSNDFLIDNPLYAKSDPEVEEAAKIYNESVREVAKDLISKEKLLVGGDSGKVSTFPIISCDDIRRNLISVEDSLYRGFDTFTCVTTLDDVGFEDNLGMFLCSKGYDVPGLCDGAICQETSNLDYVCPTESAREGNDDVCLQGPHGVSTHSSLNAMDIRGNDFVAPFDGQVIKTMSGQEGFEYCENNLIAGGGLLYQGLVNGKQVTLFVYHVHFETQSEADAIEGKNYLAGEFIAHLAKPGDSDVAGGSCIGSPQHAHIELATYDSNTDKFSPNQDGDIASLFLDVLGCVTTGDSDSSCNNRSGEPYDTDPGSSTASLSCNPEEGGEILGEFVPGKLNCTMDKDDVNDSINWESLNSLIELRVGAYNLDNNESYTWLANIEESDESNELKNSLISKFGQNGYELDRERRVDMMNYFLDTAKDLSINPHLAMTLWIEETAGGAIGSHALGCGVLYLDEMPIGREKDKEVKVHLREQLECLQNFIVHTRNFNEFACTYSGETPINGTRQEGNLSVRSCDPQKFDNNPNFADNFCETYFYIEPWADPKDE